PLGAGVLLAWLLALVLSPLQCAGEEFVFRALPMQMLGTWLRRPVLGILLPVPLFMLGHGYSWLGQVDIAVFAVVMGLLAWKTGGLEIPILLHTANNWTLFAIAPLIPGFAERGEVELLGLVLAMTPLLLLSAGIWWWYSLRAGLGLWETQRGTGQHLSSARAPARGLGGERQGSSPLPPRRPFPPPGGAAPCLVRPAQAAADPPRRVRRIRGADLGGAGADDPGARARAGRERRHRCDQR